MAEKPEWTAEGGENAQTAAEWANQVGFHETQAKKRPDNPPAQPASQASFGAQGQTNPTAGQAYPNPGQGHPGPAYPNATQYPGQTAGYPGPYANSGQGAWNQPYPVHQQFPGQIPGGLPVPYAGGGPMMAPQKSKVAAGILALLFGEIGVHKFYMGYYAQGLIMLLSVILTFGLAVFVTAPVAIVEAILYLTKTDEEFFRTYEQGRRAWF